MDLAQDFVAGDQGIIEDIQNNIISERKGY
jgi:hypothetical protein